VQNAGSVLLQTKSNMKKNYIHEHSAALQENPNKGVDIDMKMLQQDPFAAGNVGGGWPRLTNGTAQEMNHSVEGSQIGQDVWVFDRFGEGFKGYFLDLGAHDGELLSNTNRLEKMGWQGICVEPFPTNFDGRSCILDRSALGAQVGTARFTRCSGWRSSLSGFPGYGSIDDVRDPNHCSEVLVPTKPLRMILSENAVPRIIDYVSLDIEGAEFEVLKQFPFDKHCVRLWTVEHTSFYGAQPNRLNIWDFFASLGCNVQEWKTDFYAECKC
jgi:FkbM family methyltransferase